MPELTIDVDTIVAIDMHTHAEISADGHGALSPELFGASAEYFKAEGNRQPTMSLGCTRSMSIVVLTNSGPSAVRSTSLPRSGHRCAHAVLDRPQAARTRPASERAKGLSDAGRAWR